MTKEKFTVKQALTILCNPESAQEQALIVLYEAIKLQCKTPLTDKSGLTLKQWLKKQWLKEYYDFYKGDTVKSIAKVWDSTLE